MTERPTDDQYVEQARSAYCSDDVEIDDQPKLSHADDGCWVSAWVYVYDRDVEENLNAAR